MVNVDHIKTRIVEIDNFLSASPIALADSQAGERQLATMDFSKPTFDGDEFTRLVALAKPSQMTKEKEMLQETLGADLMHGDCRYIISDQSHLVSPAGFHPDTNVFVKTEIALHRNNTQGSNLCRNGNPLYVHKMHTG
jgi:hypothetical protein